MRLVRTLGAELETGHGTVQRVAAQLGYGTESVRSWVKRADVDDGHVPVVTTEEAARVKAFGAGEPGAAPGQRDLEAGCDFLGAELDRQQRR